VGSSSRSGAAAGTDVNGAVLKGNGLPEAREHLLLVNTQALGSASNRAGAFADLVLRVHGSLDLVTRVLQDRSVPTDRRLGEGRGCDRQHHGQHRCQQHYLPQIFTSLPGDFPLGNHILSPRCFRVNATYGIFCVSSNYILCFLQSFTLLKIA
jgi:hypothetical protein